MSRRGHRQLKLPLNWNHARPKAKPPTFAELREAVDPNSAMPIARRQELLREEPLFVDPTEKFSGAHLYDRRGKLAIIGLHPQPTARRRGEPGLKRDEQGRLVIFAD